MATIKFITLEDAQEAVRAYCKSALNSHRYHLDAARASKDLCAALEELALHGRLGALEGIVSGTSDSYEIDFSSGGRLTIRRKEGDAPDERTQE